MAVPHVRKNDSLNKYTGMNKARPVTRLPMTTVLLNRVQGTMGSSYSQLHVGSSRLSVNTIAPSRCVKASNMTARQLAAIPVTKAVKRLAVEIIRTTPIAQTSSDDLGIKPINNPKATPKASRREESLLPMVCLAAE